MSGKNSFSAVDSSTSEPEESASIRTNRHLCELAESLEARSAPAEILYLLSLEESVLISRDSTDTGPLIASKVPLSLNEGLGLFCEGKRLQEASHFC